MKDRIQTEDALKYIHSCEYQKLFLTPDSLAGALGISREETGDLLAKLEGAGLLVFEEGRYALTGEGREYALQVIRAHRLYETYLERDTGLKASAWHKQAEVEEHRLSREAVEALAQKLGDPRYDPHGDPIPTQTGQLPPPKGKSILEYPVGWEGCITHIEDEPEGLFDQVAAKGLAPDMCLRILDIRPDGLRLNVEGSLVSLTKPMAATIGAVALKGAQFFDETVFRLSALRSGEKAEVVGLTAVCHGTERSRLLDLGVVRGTVIEVDIRSPSGNPVAYLIRGASIALRSEQAERIVVRKIQEPS